MCLLLGLALLVGCSLLQIPRETFQDTLCVQPIAGTGVKKVPANGWMAIPSYLHQQGIV